MTTKTLPTIPEDSTFEFTDIHFKSNSSVAEFNVSNEYLLHHTNELLNGEFVTLMGLHCVYVLDYICSPSRLRLEYVALCYINNICAKTLLSDKYKNLSTAEKVKTPNSMVFVVSRDAYNMYQCLLIGIGLFQKTQQHFLDLMKHPQLERTDGSLSWRSQVFLSPSYKEGLSREALDAVSLASPRARKGNLGEAKSANAIGSLKCPIDFKVKNKKYGLLFYPTNDDMDDLANSYRWCSNILEAYGIDISDIGDDQYYINYRNLKVNKWFYLQSPTED
jgi:hypothetical protein